MKFFIVLATLLFGTLSLSAQPKPATAADNFDAERQLAKLAVEAHGGDKFRAMKSLVLNGSVDVTASTFPQPIPATFVMIFAGDKYRVEINNPFQPLRQAFDGTNTVTSIANGFTLPPFNRVGFPVLQRIGDPGFIVTSIPGNKKKKAFRVTTSEGYVTDFYLDEKTNQVKSYDSTYAVNGRTVKTSAEIDKVKVIDGVTIPEKYVQRFDLDQLTFYAAFNAKGVKVNTEVENDVFTKVN
ncbi:MAG: hypothetical protein ACRD6X_16360 [Pyrinomonadaceae bacterium]